MVFLKQGKEGENFWVEAYDTLQRKLHKFLALTSERHPSEGVLR